jgi:hypothetical protein
MFLHELSKIISAQIGIRVSDRGYTQAVTEKFGSSCAYCERKLEADRAAVEHLDGMNRFRVGLHIAGNVVISCKRCNSEKRRDDSLPVLHLADSGWESFLAHNGTSCGPDCKTCAYWKTVWPEPEVRMQNLAQARSRIDEFRSEFPAALSHSAQVLSEHKARLEMLYREGQEFAKTTITKSVAQALIQIQASAMSFPR